MRGMTVDVPLLNVERELVVRLEDQQIFHVLVVGDPREQRTFESRATDAETDIRNVTRTGALVNGANRVRGWANDEVFISVDCDGTATGIYTDVGHAPRVRVSAVVPYPSLLGSLGFDTGGVVVRAEAQAAVMGI